MEDPIPPDPVAIHLVPGLCWKARIYEYEATLPGAVAIMPLAGAGARLNGSMRLDLWGFGVAMFGRREWRRRMPTRTRIGVQIDRSSGI